MKKAKGTHRKPDPPAAFGAPEEKLSEAVLGLAKPFFEPFGDYPSMPGIRNVLTLVIVAWNAYAMEHPAWGDKGAIATARERVRAPHYPPEVATLFDAMLERRASEYATDLRLVDEWDVASDGAGGFSLHCGARSIPK